MNPRHWEIRWRLPGEQGWLCGYCLALADTPRCPGCGRSFMWAGHDR